MKKIGILISGGLDSCALVGHFLKRGYQVWPIYIRCGLRWEKAELHWTRKFLKHISHPQLKSLAVLPLELGHSYAKNWSQTGAIPGVRSSDRSVFLPARNILLIIRASLFLYAQKISQLAMATLKGNPFPDGKSAYFRTVGKILSISFGRPIQVRTPFRSLTKQQVVHRYQNWPLQYSFSCINPQGLKPCGRCNKCAERSRALK